MKKLFLLSILLGFANIAYAAPTARYDRTIIPETTGTYDLGTSLKTWLTGYFDNICLGGVCKSIWPSGTGGGTDGNWVGINNSGLILATTSYQVAIGSSATTSNSIVEITKTSAGNLIDLLMLKNTSLTAGTETGIFFAPSNIADKTRGARYSAYNDGSNNVGFKWYTGQGAAIDEKMRLSGAGLLGVGTSTPLGVLSVSSANKTTAVPLFVVASSSSAVGTSTYLLIDKSGKTGIGTTSPYLLLGVNDGIAGTYYNADSYGATSTFKGNLMIGDSLFNGQLDITSLGTGVAQLQVSTSTNDFAKVVFANTNTGTAAMFCNIYNNARSPRAGVSSSYYGGVCYAGNNYNTAGFDGIKPNGIAIFASDGDVSLGSASTNAASSSIHFFAGRGFAAANEDMTLLGGVANLGIGTTSPYARLSVVGQAVASHFTATTTSSSTLPNLITTNLRVTNGLYDSANSLGTNGYVLQTDGTKSTWVSTSSLNIAGGGSGSGTVNSGTTGQVPYYAGAGTTLTATSTLFIDTTSFVGINKTAPTERLHISGQNAFSASASTSIFIEHPAGTVGAKNKIVTGVTNGTDPYFAIETRQTGSPFGVVERLRIEGTNGYIGIGTSTPLGLMDLTGSSNSSSVSTFVGGRTLSLINTDTTNNNGNTLAFRTNDANGLLTTASSISGRYTSHSAGAINGQITFNTTNAGTNAQRGVIDSNGYFGLGTTTPGGRISVVGTTSDPYMILDNTAGQIVAGESLGKIIFTESGEFSSLADRTAAVIEPVATADHAGAGNSTGIRFSTGFSGTPVERLHLRGDGVVAFASSTPWGQYALNANGAGITGPILSVGSSTQTSFVISNNSRVGIGTSTPGMKLAVNGPIYAIGDSNQGLYLGDPSDANSRPRIVQNGPSGIATYNSFRDNGTAKFALGYGAAGTTPTGSFFISRTSDFTSPDFLLTPAGTFALGLLGNVGIGTSTTPWGKLTVAMASTTPSFVVGTAGSSTPAFYVSSANRNGKVGIATSSPATELDVNGTITQLTVKSCSLGLTTDALGSINGCVTSDQRLKKDITPITQDVTTAILSLNPVTYKWKDTKVKDDKVHSGFVAQEVQKVIPLAVSKTGVDNIGVDSNGVLAYVVKFIQGMYSDFQSLVARVTGLEKRLDEQDKRIKALEQKLQLLKN